MKNLVAIVGNNADQSSNRKLVNYIVNRYKSLAHIDIMEVKDFPMFNKPKNMEVPPFVKQQAQVIEDSDGVIIATPEYDHAPPAALTNAIAWLSYGIHPFASKPVLITGASYGMLGTSRAQGQLRSAFHAPELRASVMPGAEIYVSHSLQAFEEDGTLNDKELVKAIDSYMFDFINFIEINEQLVERNHATREAVESFSWEEN